MELRVTHINGNKYQNSSEEFIKTKDMSFKRIDVHSHYLPASYREALREAGITKPDGFPFIPEWDPATNVKMMDKMNCDKTYLSLSSPGVHFLDAEKSAKLARQVNDAGADAVTKFPGRFGLFACLPLPNVPASLKEIDYAYDKLNVDGIVLQSNTNGIYLGNDAYAPVFEQLNKRKAIIMIHPTSPAVATGNEQPSNSASPLPYPRPMIEFLFDTTRTVVDLLISGTISRYPDITIIIPHGGSVIPPVLDRVIYFATNKVLMASEPSFSKCSLTSDEISQIFRDRFYYDLAGFATPNQIHGLLRIARKDHLLYGADYPFATEMAIKELGARLEQDELFGDKEFRDAVFYKNAVKLFRKD